MEACDDPYKILALNVMSKYPDEELCKLLHDAKTVRRYITREVCSVDFYGDFLDCIAVGLIKSGRGRSVNKTLKDTSKFFYKELDMQRFRDELRAYCREFGRQVE